MPELVDDKQVFSLYEVTKSIGKTIADRYSSAYWIKAEIHKLNRSKSGYCNPELVDRTGEMQAEMRGTIWKQDFERINRNFLKLLNEPLKDGIKVLLKASIKFHPQYGLSLAILDVDPNYSLGELEREKKEAIEKLKLEGLFGKNQGVPLAILPQRIAIISVETSKGYSDFIEVIDQNMFGYRFFHMLFPAVLQGDAAVTTIKRQLIRIKKVKNHFDAVAIIRGGGGEVGLSSFNNYELAKAICTFPLPVFTGIGHSTNLTVCEMVAFKNAITPTKLAEIFLQQFHNFAVPVQRSAEILMQETRRFLANQRSDFDAITRLFRNLTKNRLKESKDGVHFLSAALVQETRFRLNYEKDAIRQSRHSIIRALKSRVMGEQHELLKAQETLRKENARFIKTQAETLKNIEKVISLVDPMNVVKRGYTLTTVNGELLRTIDQLKNGDVISTLTIDGIAESAIIKTKKN